MRELCNNLRLRLRALRKRRQLERDLEDEIAFHLAMRDGDSVGFGNPVRVKEDLREQWTFPTLESFLQDLRYASRLLLRSPLFTLVAAGSLALGIGASTAIFSLANAILLKSLALPDAGRLRLVLWTGQPRSPMQGRSGYTIQLDGVPATSSFSWPVYEHLRDRLHGSVDLMGFTRGSLTVRAGRESHYSQALFVTRNAPTVLGLSPRLGRMLGADDDRVSAPAVALVSSSYWETRLGLDPSAVGRDITVNGQRVTIVGVLPRGFQGLDASAHADFLLPMARVREFGPAYCSQAEAGRWWVQVLGRLQPGVDGAAARAAIEAAARQVDESYPESPTRRGAPWRPVVVEGARGVPSFGMRAQGPLLILACVVGAMLLIACANLANLLLARGATRAREIAVRMSIGCSRARLLRQLLTESLLLASLGAVAGLLLAQPLANGCLRLWAGGENVPELDVAPDGRTLLFTAVATVFTALLFGLAPAWRATRADLTPGLKSSAPGAAGGRSSRTSRALVVAQVALCTLLLSAAGLFVRSFAHLMNIDPGFQTRNLLLFTLDATRSGYTGERAGEFYERVRSRLSAIPGVEAATFSAVALVSHNMSNASFRLSGESPVASREQTTYVLGVGAGFHSAMRIEMVAGREIGVRDTAASAKVVVVNEAFVKEHCGGHSPIGRLLHLDGAPGAPAEPAREIVGVCRNARYESLKTAPPATAYLAALQSPDWAPQANFELRSALSAAALAAAARAVVTELDENVPLAGVRSQQEQIRLTLGTERLLASLVSTVGLGAALLAAIGLYGLLAYAVARRRAEIGVRLALGAGRGDVLWMVLRDSLAMVLVGLALGVPGALVLARLIRSSLSGITPADPPALLAAPLFMTLLALLAAWLPARRAARVDPAHTLRCE